MDFSRLRFKYGCKLLKSPAGARHAEHSMIYSADDEPGKPSPRLLACAVAAVQAAMEISLKDVSERISAPPLWPDVFPGEHYRLLAGLVKSLQPRSVIEIGTASGLSALALMKFLPAGASLVTFDIAPWDQSGETHLRSNDFADGRLIQHVEDITVMEGLEKRRDLFEKADLIFIDAAKDGHMEQRIIDNFSTLKFVNYPIMVFDDTKVWNMLDVWRRIARPKLDLSSFGHWSGTGIVDWQ